MLHTDTIPLPNQLKPEARNPGQAQQTQTEASRLGSGKRAASLGARSVRFAERAGAMDGEAPSGALASSHTFLNNHPDLDLWNLLGVPPDSKFGVISKAYRTLARNYHPDALLHLPEAERRRRTETFQLMGEAREILTNPITRAQYAAWRLRRGNPAPSNRGRTPGQAQRYEEAQAQARAREAGTPPRAPNWAGFSTHTGGGVPPRASEPASSSGSRDNPWNTGSNRGFPSGQPSWRRTTSWEGQPPGGVPPTQGPWTQPKEAATTPPRGSAGVPFDDPWNSTPGAPPSSVPKTPPKQPFQMPFNSNPWQGGATSWSGTTTAPEMPKKAAPPPQSSYGSGPRPEAERPHKSAPPRQAPSQGGTFRSNVPPPAERKRTREPQPYAGPGTSDPPAHETSTTTGKRPPPASRELFRTPQPYQGRGPTEILRPPKPVLENEILEEGVPERSAQEWEELQSEAPEMPRSRAWSEAEDGRSDHTSQGWEKESLNSWDVPKDPQDGEFVHVEVESSDDDWFDVPFDDEEWAAKPGAPPDLSAEQKEFEQSLHQDITDFLEFFRKQKLSRAAPAIKDTTRQETPLPESVRQDCIRGEGGGLRLDRSVQEWLRRGSEEGSTRPPAAPASRPPGPEKKSSTSAPEPTGPTGIPAKAMPISPPPAKWLESPTPPTANVGLSSKAPSQAAPATRTQAAQTAPAPGRSSRPTHHGFDPTEVDFGEESEDDRTPEEKADDDALLERTKQNIEAFLRAPEAVKRQLRSSAWKKCYVQLASIRAKLDRPDPGADEDKYTQDLAAGFTVAEARKMMKARRRAARHQRVIEEKPNLTWDDLPKSWITPKQRTLRPGWMAEKSEARLNRKRSGSQPTGRGHGDRWSRGTPEPRYPPQQNWKAAPAQQDDLPKKPKPNPPAPPGWDHGRGTDPVQAGWNQGKGADPVQPGWSPGKGADPVQQGWNQGKGSNPSFQGWSQGKGADPVHPAASPWTPPKFSPKQPPYPPPPSRINEEEWGQWTPHGKK
eukprot:Skav201918  [mRNA]  locus=scaffold3992:208439:211456:- [translate_table: standard]